MCAHPANEQNTRKLDQMPTTELKPLCEKLYNAGQGRWLGTDEHTFIGVLTHYGPRWALAGCLFDKHSRNLPGAGYVACFGP